MHLEGLAGPHRVTLQGTYLLDVRGSRGGPTAWQTSRDALDDTARKPGSCGEGCCDVPRPASTIAGNRGSHLSPKLGVLSSSADEGVMRHPGASWDSAARWSLHGDITRRGRADGLAAGVIHL